MVQFPCLAIIIAIFSLMIVLIVGDSYSIDATESENVELRVAAAGAWGCTPNTNETVNSILRHDPDLVVGLGDYSYNNTEKCWFDVANPLLEQMKIAIGNNDIQPYEKYGNLTEVFGLDLPYYSFDRANAHFATISTEDVLSNNGIQYNWLKDDLAKAASNDSIDWIIVFFHRLGYTSSPPNYPEDNISRYFHPLFDKYSVDLVLQGHNLFYERTFPLSHGVDAVSPIVEGRLETQFYNDQDGPIFATVGTGGHSLQEYQVKPAFVASQYSGYGYLDIGVNSTQLDAKFYANTGGIKDGFTILKTSSDQMGSNYGCDDLAHRQIISLLVRGCS